MDRRVKRTRGRIINAFLALRAKKNIEKISVKELCDQADINKSTFYTHFKDIYDLTDQLERQTAADIISGIGHPEYIFSQPAVFTRELYYACLSQASLTHILFSGNRENLLVVRLEEGLKQTVYEMYPELRENAAADILFTLEIYGEYYAFRKCRHFGDEEVIRILCAHWERTVEMLKAPELSYLGLGL